MVRRCPGRGGPHRQGLVLLLAEVTGTVTHFSNGVAAWNSGIGPSVLFTDTPTIVDRGEEVLLEVRTRVAGSCQITPSWGSVTMSALRLTSSYYGKAIVRPQETTTYTVTCSGEAPQAASVTVTVRDTPYVRFTATPAMLTCGRSELSWTTAASITGCTISPPLSTGEPVLPSGAARTDELLKSTTFVMTCTDGRSGYERRASVTIASEESRACTSSDQCCRSRGLVCGTSPALCCGQEAAHCVDELECCGPLSCERGRCCHRPGYRGSSLDCCPGSAVYDATYGGCCAPLGGGPFNSPESASPCCNADARFDYVGQQAVCCLPAQRLGCRSNEECCNVGPSASSRRVACTGQRCCNSAGAECDFDSECCTGLTCDQRSRRCAHVPEDAGPPDAGACYAGLANATHVCANDSECCAGSSCRDAPGTVSGKHCCLELRQPCDDLALCCPSSRCSLGSFGPRHCCNDEGKPCSGPGDCCQETFALQCGAGGTCCRPLGAECYVNSVCCSNSCVGAVPGSSPGNCQ